MQLLIFASLTFFATVAHGAELPVFDAHIHYSHDAVELVPPAEAVALLRAAGVKRALLSSSNDDGTQKLFEATPSSPHVMPGPDPGISAQIERETR